MEINIEIIIIFGGPLLSLSNSLNEIVFKCVSDLLLSQVSPDTPSGHLQKKVFTCGSQRPSFLQGLPAHNDSSAR